MEVRKQLRFACTRRTYFCEMHFCMIGLSVAPGHPRAISRPSAARIGSARLGSARPRWSILSPILRRCRPLVPDADIYREREREIDRYRYYPPPYLLTSFKIRWEILPQDPATIPQPDICTIYFDLLHFYTSVRILSSGNFNTTPFSSYIVEINSGATSNSRGSPRK